MAVRCASPPARLDDEAIGRPVLRIVACCRSSNVAIGRPLTSVTRSPAGKPACAAGEPGSTPPIRATLLAAAEDHEQRREDYERENEIGDRTRRDDRGAVAQRLAGEGVRPLLRRHRRRALEIGRARRVGVAVEFDVAAKRKGGEPPAGAALVDPGEEFGAEAERERVDLHSAPASNEVMAELVKENDEADDENERQDVPPHPIDGSAQFLQKRHYELSGGRAPARPSVVVTNWYTMTERAA